MTSSALKISLAIPSNVSVISLEWCFVNSFLPSENALWCSL